MNQKVNKVWSFASDSNPNIEYETLQYVDGTTSCNCQGWTRRVAADGSRSCKHTRYVDMGTADRIQPAGRDPNCRSHSHACSPGTPSVQPSSRTAP